MKKLILFLLIIPLLASAQAPSSDSVARAGSVPATISNGRSNGNNASNYQFQYLAKPNKMVDLVTGYQFNNYTGTQTQAQIDAKANLDSLMAYGVSVVKFGLLVNDTTTVARNTNRSAILNAANYASANGYKSIIFPAGTIYINGETQITRNVSVIGQGSNLTTLDYSLGDSTLFPTGASLWATGYGTKIANLSSPVIVGDTLLNLNAPITAFEGDLLLLKDTTSYSFSFRRAAYKQGEFFVVKRNATNDMSVLVDRASNGAYPTITSAELYKQDATQTNFIGFSLRAFRKSNTTGLYMENFQKSMIRDVTALNGGARNIWLVNGYGLSMEQVNSYRLSAAESTPTTSYGLALAGVSNFKIDGGDFFGQRHAIVLGGAGGEAGGIPNRFGTVTNTITSSANNSGFNMHGSNQYITIDKNYMWTGFEFGGNNIELVNNTINTNNKWARGAVSGMPIQVNEVNGNSLKITGNTIYGRYYGSLSNGISYTPVDGIDTTGVFDMSDNNIYYDMTNAGNDANSYYVLKVEVESGGTAGNLPLRFNIDNNTVIGINNRRELRFAISGFDATHQLGSVHMTNNKLSNASIWAKNNSRTYVENNTVSDTKWYGIQLAGGEIVLKNNHLRNYALTSGSGAPAGYHSAYRITGATSLFRIGNTGVTTATPTSGAYINNVTTVTSGFEDIQGTESLSSVTTNQTMKLPSIGASTFLFNDATQRPIGVSGTGSGSVVRATSPTLVAPALGTPTALVLTNATGLPTTGILNNAVTYAKMQNVSTTSRLLGSSSTTTPVQEITLGIGLSMSGGTLLADTATTLLSKSNANSNFLKYGGATKALNMNNQSVTGVKDLTLQAGNYWNSGIFSHGRYVVDVSGSNDIDNRYYASNGVQYGILFQGANGQHSWNFGQFSSFNWAKIDSTGIQSLAVKAAPAGTTPDGMGYNHVTLPYSNQTKAFFGLTSFGRVKWANGIRESNNALVWGSGPDTGPGATIDTVKMELTYEGHLGVVGHLKSAQHPVLTAGTDSIAGISSTGILGRFSPNSFATIAGTNTFAGTNNFNIGLNTRHDFGVNFWNNDNTYKINVHGSASGTDKTQQLQDKDGTIALTTDATGYIVNATTTGLSNATLNSTYPDVPVGYRVICPSITLGGAIYTKATEAGSSDVWLLISAPVQP